MTRRTLTLIAAMSLIAGLMLTGTGLSMAAESAAPIAQDATPSATQPGQIQLPTATNTVVGGPTATPSRTPTLVPILVEASGDPTNLRSGPGLDFDIVGTVEQGTTLPLIGRLVTLPWLLVEFSDTPGGQAWIFEPLSTVLGDITTVPLVEAPAPPTEDPTLAVLQATATVLLQTPGAVETATAQALSVPTGVFTVTPEGGADVVGLPTYTAPAPLQQPDSLAAPTAIEERDGIAPGAIIIMLGGMGLLTLGLGLLRRL